MVVSASFRSCPRRPPDSAFALASPTRETGRGERGERGGRRCRCCRRCGGDSRRCCCCCRRGRRRCRRGFSSPFHAITRTSSSLGIIWRGRFGATLTSARPAPDALPLRSVVATRSRRAGRRAVSVGGRRTLNSTLHVRVSGRRRLLSGPRAYCPLLPGTEETKTRSVTRGDPVSSRRTIRAALRAPSAPHRLGRARDSVRGSFETGAAAPIPVPARDVVSSRRLSPRCCRDPKGSGRAREGPC